MSLNWATTQWKQQKHSYVEGEGAIDLSMVTRWFKKFCLGCKNLEDQARLSKPKTMDYKAVFQSIEVNPVSIRQAG